MPPCSPSCLRLLSEHELIHLLNYGQVIEYCKRSFVQWVTLIPPKAIHLLSQSSIEGGFGGDSDAGDEYYMFTNNQRQEERTGKYGTPRVQYLQELVAQFQNASTEASKEKISANLANFAYDPFSYTFQRQLNVLELFFDCITEPNEKLIEFGADGICNSCVYPANAAVNYALGALYYLCNASTKEEILRPEVVDIIKRYAAAGAVSVGFSNLAQAFLDKHVPENH
ncbi:hypothetical protein Tco_0760484 [Tanacetum coccineum]